MNTTTDNYDFQYYQPDAQQQPKKKKSKIMKYFKIITDLLYVPITVWDFLTERMTDMLENKKIVNMTSSMVCISLNVILVLTAMGSLNKLNFGFFLLLTSVLNAFNFLTKTKSYQLLRHNVEDTQAQSSHMRTNILSLDDKDENVMEVTALETWNPSYISTQIFVFFSPLQVLIVLGSEGYKMPVLGALAHFVLGAAVSLLLWVVVHSYQGLINDRQIIFGEVYEEYNRFASKRLSVIKEDKGVQVGPLWSPYAESPQRGAPSAAANQSSGSPQEIVRRKSNVFQRK